MKAVVRSAFLKVGGGPALDGGPQINADLHFNRYSLLDSEAQAQNVRRMLWQAAGYIKQENAGRNISHDFSVKDKRNALSHYFRVFSAFIKALRFHVCS